MAICSEDYGTTQYSGAGYLSADITKKALGLLPQRLVDTGAQIIGTVRDEIILEVPEEMADDAPAILRQTMIEAGKAYLIRVPVEVEVVIGEAWAENKKNPAPAS